MVRHLSRFAIGAAALLGAALLLGGLVLWRLSAAPLRLDPLLPYVEQALSDDDLRVEIGAITLDWTALTSGLTLDLHSVRLFGPDGALLLRLPAGEVTLSVPALLERRIEPVALEVTGLAATVLRREDGGIQLGLGPQPPETGGAAERILRELLTALRQPPDPARPFGRLDRLAVADAQLLLVDRRTETRWRLPRAALVLERVPGGVAGRIEGAIADGETETAIRLTGRHDSATGRLGLALRFAGLTPAAFSGLDPALADLARLHLPLSGEIAATLTGAEEWQDIHGTVQAGAGRIDLPEIYDAPLALDGADLAARYDPAARRLHIAQARLARGPLRATTKGTITFPAQGRPEIALEGTLSDVAIAELKRLWPERVAGGARNWVRARVTAGRIPAADYRLALTIGQENLPAEALAIGFTLENVTAVYHPNLPPLTEARGRARLSARDLAVSLDAGRVLDLNLRAGEGRIPDFHAPGPEIAEIDLAAAGPLGDLLDLLDRPPLGYPSEAGLRPEAVEGQVDLRLHLRLPLKRDLDFSEITFAADADIARLSIRDLVGELDLASGTAEIAVDGEGLSLAGRAALAGIPAEISWRQDFESGSGPPSRVTIAAVLDEAARARLGLDAAPYLEGPLGVALTLTGEVPRHFTGTARLDLVPSRLSLPPLGWRKPPGEAGQAEIRFTRPEAGGLVLDHFSATTNDLAAEGAARFADGRLRHLALDRLRLENRLDLALTLENAADAPLDVMLDAAFVDVSGLLDQLYGGGAGAPAAENLSAGDLFTGGLSYTIEGEIDRLVLRPDLPMQDVSITARSAGQGIERLELAGQFSDGGQVAAALAPSGTERRSLVVTTRKAGALMKALGLTSAIEGGRGTLTATLPPAGGDGPIRGQIEAHDFRVTGTPVLARLFTLASLTGILDVLRGEGLSFAELELPFALTPERLEVGPARAVGSQLGITLQGRIDRDSDRLHLSGTLAPIYTVNSLLGRIPLLGDLLGGEEGIFAIAYSIEGPRQDPRVQANPLSAVTPGFLRNLLWPGVKSEAETGSELPSAAPDGGAAAPEVERDLRRQRPGRGASSRPKF